MIKIYPQSRLDIWDEPYIIDDNIRTEEDKKSKVEIIQIEHGYMDSYIVEVIDKELMNGLQKNNQ